ncbi:hypothetical protein [Hydrocarboniphaga effusa]|jgi:hypothetical protein|uniref:hypothetical protein n=1 Tax=Hydrocarboniphaga effusa TaxID=243629 RepID=UPI00398C1574
METAVRKPDVPPSTDEKKPSTKFNVAAQTFIWIYRLWRVVDFVERHWKEHLDKLTDL